MAALTLARLSPGLSPLARAALTGDAALLARLLRGAALTIDFSALEAATRSASTGGASSGAGGAGLAARDGRLPAGAGRGGNGAARVELVAERVRGALATVEDAARRYARSGAGGASRAAPGGLPAPSADSPRSRGRMSSAPRRR